VGDATNGNIKVYANAAQTPTLSRTIGLPTSLSVVHDNTRTTTWAANLELTGLDVAWQEVWATMVSDVGGRVIFVFDAQSGLPKAALFDSRATSARPSPTRWSTIPRR